jgi:hypothetical protein
METTFNKEIIKSLKLDIISSAALQKAMKNQRKTVHLKGERIIEPDEANMRVFLDGMKLRIMYAAYGLMRGKSFSQTENHYPEENHPLNKYKNAINRCIEVHTNFVKEKEKEKISV